MFNPKALKETVLFSICAREQQGYDMAGLRQKLLSIDEKDCDAWFALYGEISKAKMIQDYKYVEPDSLEEIKRLRPNGQRTMTYTLTDLVLKDKICGAFMGRVCGVILGRPVEGESIVYIEEFLKGAGCYPLDYYFPARSIIGGKVAKCNYSRMRCTREYLKYAEPDDDINYVFLALKLVEKLGVNFSTLDVGYNWLENVPLNWVWGPERTAYLNLARYTEEGYHMLDLDDATLWQITHYMNGYNEYIGALIRGDIYGYISAGLPEYAAELAYRDAALTHVKNGIYGEMFASAMIAAAFCTDDISEVIEAGLSEIPENCRLAEAIRNTVGWYAEYGDWHKVYEEIDKHYNHYGDAHTINNAAFIVNALLASGGDFEKTLCIAVMQGQDTDCTAATAGSVAGIMTGAAALPEKWTKPLNDTVMSGVFGESKRSISATGERIYNISRMTTKFGRKIKFRHAEPE